MSHPVERTYGEPSSPTGKRRGFATPASSMARDAHDENIPAVVQWNGSISGWRRELDQSHEQRLNSAYQTEQVSRYLDESPEPSNRSLSAALVHANRRAAEAEAAAAFERQQRKAAEREVESLRALERDARRLAEQNAAYANEVATGDRSVAEFMGDLERLNVELLAEKAKAAAEESRAKELADALEATQQRLAEATARADAAAAAAADGAPPAAGGGGVAGEMGPGTQALVAKLQQELEHTKGHLAQKSQTFNDLKARYADLQRRSGAAGRPGFLLRIVRKLFVLLGFSGFVVVGLVVLAYNAPYPRSVDVYRTAS